MAEKEKDDKSFLLLDKTNSSTVLGLINKLTLVYIIAVI